ncbi:MAG: RluA family pseudouridine synthase, partial [Defluviitoga tunisiensis]
MEKVIYKVNEGDDQKRLDLFVLEKLPIKVSRNMIQELIKRGAVTVNGGIKKSHYLVKKGDEIVICLDNLEISDHMNEEDSISPENIPLDILYEDEDIIVINKPAGLLVHPTNKIRSGTLVNALMYHIKDFDKIGDDPNRLGIVHRLDK